MYNSRLVLGQILMIVALLAAFGCGAGTSDREDGKEIADPKVAAG
jgi:hypothetical protein